MDDPLLLATGAVSLLWLCVVLGTSPRLFVMLTAAWVLFLPKISIVAVPGTTVGLRGEDVLLALLAIKILWDLGGGANLSPELRRVAKWLLALLPIGIIGIIVGQDDGILRSPLVAALFLARRYEYFVLAIAAYLYFRDSDRHRYAAVRMLAAAAIVNSLVAIAQSRGVLGGWPDGVYVDVSERVTGLTGGPYELAAMLAITSPLFVWRALSGTKVASGVLGVVLIMTALWFTQSRVGLIAGVVVVVAMVAASARRSPWVVVAASFLTAAGLAAWVWRPLPPGAASESRFATLDLGEMWNATKRAYEVGDYHLINNAVVISNISDASFALRIDRWFNYLDGLMQLNPLTGLGPSAAKEAVDGNYVRILFEFGIIGLAIFLALLIAVGGAVRKVPPGPVRAMAVWGGAGLLLQATFIDVFEASKAAETYWFVFGLGLAALASHRATDANHADQPGREPAPQQLTRRY